MACATPTVIEKPVPVEVVRVEVREVPTDLTRTEPLQPIPEALTYAQALSLWQADRSSLQTTNARLRAIEELHDDE